MDIDIRKIKQLLDRISNETDVFAKTTGLHCKPGCGKCCENPHIETTVAEMLPLAEQLWSTGQAQEYLDKIEAKDNGVCVLYQPDPSNPGHGRCGNYEYRPGICRLFGFSAKKNKTGQKELVICKIMKELYPQDIAKANEHIQSNKPVADISTHTMNVFSIDPQNSRTLLPMNQAIQEAIKRLGSSY